jgi:glycosyltransferase involved in cell wall biosynthesis
MRILQISSARVYGGGERHFVDLCRGLAARGHEVFVALRPTNEWQHRLDFLPPENILHVSIRNSFGVLSAIRIADYIRDKKIEVVHAHVARDYIPASIACSAAKDAKFVLTRHLSLPLKPFNKFALKNVAKAIGVSQPVAEGMKRIFPASKVETIPNGIDVGRPEDGGAAGLGSEFRDFHGVPHDAPLVGTLGDLRELKGQRDFVLAAAEVTKRIPEARFVVAGRDNSSGGQFRRELRRLAAVLDLEERIVWLDWLDDTTAFYAAVDLFVSPSRSESFGLAILEAMARGCPVVATATDGAVTLLDEGRLAPVEDPVGLAAKIVVLLSDREACRAEGELMRDRAAERYSLSKMLDAVERAYAGLFS